MIQGRRKSLLVFLATYWPEFSTESFELGEFYRMKHHTFELGNLGETPHNGAISLGETPHQQVVKNK